MRVKENIIKFIQCKRSEDWLGIMKSYLQCTLLPQDTEGMKLAHNIQYHWSFII